jgi:carboxymethylenebutenolidase
MKQGYARGRFLGAMLVAVIMCDPLCNALAQDWAKQRLNNSPRHGEWVDLKSGERTIKAFIVYPERKEKTPVVLVVHEIFGLSD